MIDLKSYGGARALSLSKPAVPIIELVSVIHNGGTEVEKCDAPQVMAEGFSTAVAKDAYFIVCQYAFWTLRPG